MDPKIANRRNESGASALQAATCEFWERHRSQITTLCVTLSSILIEQVHYVENLC